MSDTPTRAGFVALLGETNAGKSTLLNALVGQKVSIVTHKVQTTRTTIRGIAIEGDAQIVFVDTPGLFRPRRRLDRAMVAAAWSGASEADIVVLLVEAHRGITDGVAHAIEALSGDAYAGRPLVLAINKIDRVPRERLLALTATLNDKLDFAASFMLSALRGEGVADLRRWLGEHMPPGPWLYPEDQLADMPMRMLAAEITREKAMLRLHQELPYQLTVETGQWAERKDGSVRIDQVIYVAREGHRPIVLGKNGQTLKQIGQSARRELAEALGRPVHLFVHVKLREGWLDDPERYREIGLDFGA